MNTQLNYQALQKDKSLQHFARIIRHRVFTWQTAVFYGVAGCLVVGAVICTKAGDGDAAENLFAGAAVIVVLSFLFRTPNRMKQFAKDNGFTFTSGTRPRTPQDSLLGHSASFNTATDEVNHTVTQTLWHVNGSYGTIPFTIGSLVIYRRGLMNYDSPFGERYAGVVKINTGVAFPSLLLCSKLLEEGMTIFDTPLIRKQPDWEFTPFGDLTDALYSIYTPKGSVSLDKTAQQQLKPFLKWLAGAIVCDIELNSTSIVLYIPNGIDIRPEGMQKLFSIISSVPRFFNGHEHAGPLRR